MEFAATPSNAHLTYFGGRVCSNLQVVQVLYGSGSYLPNVTGSASPSVAAFYAAVLNSKYLDWLSEYDTNITAAGGSAGTNQQIGRGAFAGRFLITPSRRNSGSTIDDSQVQSELAAQIASGNLPAPSTDAFGNSNTYYAIFFPHGVRLTLAGSSSCVSGGFCAYHGTIANVNGNEVYYGVHPDMQAGSGCDTGCGAGTTFENQTSTASHEMIETITDPEVALATNLAPPLAWYDQSNGEIGDICNQQQATIVGADAITYTVQKEWSNSAGACILEKALPIVWKNVPYQGNPGDNAANCFGGNCGSVQYRYDISEYQVTNTQYAEFLNAKAASDPLGLYNPSMGSDPNNGGIPQNGVSGGFTYSVKSGFENMPVTYVSFYSALRFANWLNNGKGAGDTETVAYTLLGGTPIPSNGTTVIRNPGATIFLPSENEWYKAAYFSPAGVYFAYPFATNAATTCAAPSATPNTANCNSAVGQVMDVGAYAGSQSPWGTFDQGGNVEEWTDGIVPSSFNTVVRGASWSDPAGNLAAGFLESQPPSGETSTIGFRVVRVLPPACGLGSELWLILAPLLWLRGRRKRKPA